MNTGNEVAWHEFLKTCENPTWTPDRSTPPHLVVKFFTRRGSGHSWERYRNIKVYYESNGVPQPQVIIQQEEVGVDQYLGAAISASNVTFVQFMWEQRLPQGPNNPVWAPKSAHTRAKENCYFVVATCQTPDEQHQFRCIIP